MIETLFSPRLLRPLFWLLTAFSLVMAVLPQPPSVGVVEMGDKVQHMLAFGVLTLVGRLAWPHQSVWLLVGFLALFGLAIEVVQAIPPLHRDSDWRDFVADGIAIASTALFAQFLVRLLYRSETT